MTTKGKICPLFVMSPADVKSECIGPRCQWWIDAYTIENIQIFDCAMVINAKKNSEGKVPV